MRYVPRPIPITFVASNGDLCRRNEAFYRGPQAPEFVLANLEPLDDHIVSQRDGLALAALFDDYHPVEVEKGQVLLQRNDPEHRDPSAAEWSLLAEHEVRVGERIPLGADACAFVYATVEMKPRWTARLRSLMLRPPPARIRLRFQDGKGIIRRHQPRRSGRPVPGATARREQRRSARGLPRGRIAAQCRMPSSSNRPRAWKRTSIPRCGFASIEVRRRPCSSDERGRCGRAGVPAAEARSRAWPRWCSSCWR